MKKKNKVTAKKKEQIKKSLQKSGQLKPDKEKPIEVDLNKGQKIVRHNGIADMTLAEVKDLGAIFAQSGMFSDARSASQAVVKIMAGKELGVAPMTAMTKIFVVEGKVTLSAEVMAGLIKKSGDYDYVVKRLDTEVCELMFCKFQGGKWIEIGPSKFTIEDARKVTNKSGKSLVEGVNWRNYPRNMLFARALSNGARWYCAHLIHGVYHYDEMGLNVDGNDAVINITPESKPQPEPAKPKIEPTQAEIKNDAIADIQENIREKLEKLGAKTKEEKQKMTGVQSLAGLDIKLLVSINDRLAKELKEKTDK
jgi:hypothetical protein